MLLAELALARGDEDTAERELTRALEIEPGLAGARALRGLARALRRESLRRLDLAKIGGGRLSPGPIMPPTIEELEFNFPELGDLRQGALADLEFLATAARRLSPDQLSLALAMRSQLGSDPRGAMDALRTAILRPRPSAELLRFAAIAALESGDGAGAQEYSTRAIALWPGHPAARLARAQVAFAFAGGEGTPGRDDHLREALREAEAAQSAGAEMPDAALVRGNAALALGEFSRAETSFASALERDPDCVSALLGRANARIGLERTADAVLDFQEALRRLPDTSCLRKKIDEYLAEQPGGH